eukprot:4240745-Prymnesium_polylepis.1
MARRSCSAAGWRSWMPATRTATMACGVRSSSPSTLETPQMLPTVCSTAIQTRILPWSMHPLAQRAKSFVPSMPTPVAVWSA